MTAQQILARARRPGNNYDKAVNLLFKHNKLSRPERVMQGFRKGFRFGTDGWLLGLPFYAYEMANAERGEMVPTAIGRGAGLFTYPAFAAVTTGLLCLIPGIGPGVAAVAGSLLATIPNTAVEDRLIGGVRFLNQTGRNIRRLEMGGNYQDTESAMNQRYSAIHEMNAAMQTSRRYLGQEAALFHR